MSLSHIQATSYWRMNANRDLPQVCGPTEVGPLAAQFGDCFCASSDENFSIVSNSPLVSARSICYCSKLNDAYYILEITLAYNKVSHGQSLCGSLRYS